MGFWKTHQEAENVLKYHCQKFHEHWCNSAVIEYHPCGYVPDRSSTRSFYFTSDIEQTPKKNRRTFDFKKHK